jgi:hypothetical protein
MPKKQKSVKKTTARVKASAKSIVNINIGKGKSTPKPTVPSAKRPSKKAEIVQNVIRTSPTIYNPAPTPFQISAPQPKPFSSAAEIAEEVKRLVRTDYERAVQQPEILRLPGSAIPTGSSVVEPQFNNMEVPTSFSQLETTPARTEKRGRPKGTDPKIAQSKEEARRVLDRMGITYRESDSLGTLQAKYREAVSGLALMKKDPSV